MISKEIQSKFRSNLFKHLDGIVVAPSAYTLKERGVIDYLLANKECSLQKLTKQFNANEGYLNVALRTLASQGWLIQHIDNKNDHISYAVSEMGKIAFKYVNLYEDAVNLLKFSEKFHPRSFEAEPFLRLEKVFNDYKKDYEIDFSEDQTVLKVQKQVLKHIEGTIIGPVTVHLGMSGMFHKYFMETRFSPEEFHKDADIFQRLLDIFHHFGWFTKKNGTYQFTEKGLFYAKRASAYGVTVSYIPTLRRLDDLIFGDPFILKKLSTKGKEAHVDREMNVWGSGGAHASYFKVIDEIIINLFNKPLEEQPKGILDMGCGNGAFLQHLYYVIEKHTLRGKMLDEHPLILVGADYNEAAIKITKANLINADIWAKVVWGDIGNPALLAKDLNDKYDINLKELLNVRTFLDHNRVWKEPSQTNPDRISGSTGAYAYEGKRINNNFVEESLLEHFKQWEPYVRKFGLLIIELHTIAPELTADNIGNTGATAYDATHGYSDQYIVEVDVFNKIMKEAGLISDEKIAKKFPNNDLATVTVNLFKAKQP
ncbi:class I SAM-dependent methyltransferase [Leptobacterium sp. I13]|uniref:class I SAM-dependent methyltransferase n=1 Tax=Leptobacterium meishanense TaxID=3128904 RepID=UPI0030EF5162